MPPGETPRVLSAESGGPEQHWSVDVAFPVYGLCFVKDDVVLLAGGGGGSRTGVKNRLSLHKIDVLKRQLHLNAEHELSKTEDAPMSIAVHTPSRKILAGINSAPDILKLGINENLRVFEYTENTDRVFATTSKQTMNSTNEDDYQKVTSFSRSNPTKISIGSTNSQFSLLNFPELNFVFGSISYEGEEVIDSDFNDSGELVLATSGKKLCVWSTQPVARGEKQEAVQVIERPDSDSLSCNFRAAKFGRGRTRENVYTILNSSSTAKRSKEKKSFLSVWNSKNWKLLKTKNISQKPITAFTISDDGTLLGYASADLTVAILDANSLQSIVTVLSAHGFPVTALAFNPSGSLLVSGSADNSIRILQIPAPGKRGGYGYLWNILVTILIVVFAILVQRQFGAELLLAASNFIP